MRRLHARSLQSVNFALAKPIDNRVPGPPRAQEISSTRGCESAHRSRCRRPVGDPCSLPPRRSIETGTTGVSWTLSRSWVRPVRALLLLRSMDALGPSVTCLSPDVRVAISTGISPRLSCLAMRRSYHGASAATTAVNRRFARLQAIAHCERPRPQQSLDIHVMRMRFKRIPEEDDEIDPSSTMPAPTCWSPPSGPLKSA